MDPMLQSLGKTADEVASTLRAKGIQGVPNTIRHLNPIVRYAQSQIAGCCGMHIVDHKLTIHFVDGREKEEVIPQAVKEFLEAFNRGQYRDLLLSE
jgi:hypothetical protein